VQGWFSLVANIKAKYRIQDDDTYNFDETGFMMGQISTRAVVTASDRSGRPKQVQPGNREWTTVIQGINATGWAIPPFVIFQASNHLSNWYKDEDLPHDWVVGVFENGWTHTQSYGTIRQSTGSQHANKAASMALQFTTLGIKKKDRPGSAFLLHLSLRHRYGQAWHKGSPREEPWPRFNRAPALYTLLLFPTLSYGT
jgi:hypothetical protein